MMVLYYLFQNPAPKDQDIQQYFQEQQVSLDLDEMDIQAMQVMMYKDFESGKTHFLAQGGSHLVAFHAGDLHLRRRQARREHTGIQYGQRGTLLREYLLS